MSRFVLEGDVQAVEFDWGSAGMRCDPPARAARRSLSWT
jgi:hypothetical protein